MFFVSWINLTTMLHFYPWTMKIPPTGLSLLGLSFNSNLVFKNIFCACLRVYGYMQAKSCTWKSKNNLGSWFSPSPCGSQGLSPGCKAWQQAPTHLFFFFSFSFFLRTHSIKPRLVCTSIFIFCVWDRSLTVAILLPVSQVWGLYIQSTNTILFEGWTEEQPYMLGKHPTT